MEIMSTYMPLRHPLITITNEIKYLGMIVYIGVREVVLIPFPGGGRLRTLGTVAEISMC